jgi:hypothetical protein
MAKHLLDRPKVRPTLEKMSGGAVPQTVRPHVRGVRHLLQEPVHCAANLAGVDPAPSPAQEERRTAVARDHLTSTELKPSLKRCGRWYAERDRPLLGSLAHDPNEVGTKVDVVDVQAHQLTDPDSTGIQQLQHRSVSQMDCVLVVRGNYGQVERSADLVLSEHSWQGLVTLGRHQAK